MAIELHSDLSHQQVAGSVVVVSQQFVLVGLLCASCGRDQVSDTGSGATFIGLEECVVEKALSRHGKQQLVVHKIFASTELTLKMGCAKSYRAWAL